MAAAILSSLRGKSFPPFLRLPFFSDSSALSSSASDPHFMVDYLMKSCGLSAAEAAQASKPLGHLRSTEKPEAVLCFLRSHGFGEAHLRKLIPQVPTCLRYDVKRTLVPKLEVLRSMGFSEPDIVDVLVVQPRYLLLQSCHSLLHKLKMWENLFGSRDLLLKHLKKTVWFLSYSVEKKLSPNLKFLIDECGIPKDRISRVLRRNPYIMGSKSDTLRALAARAEEMGVSRGSKMFMPMVNVLCMVKKVKSEAIFNIMRKFGWSDDEFYTAIKKQPTVLGLSTEVLQKRMDFFVNDVGCTPSYIAQRPIMLNYSMEKRVLPRVRVMKVLKSKGLWNGQLQLQLLSFLKLPDAIFFKKFVHPYETKSSKPVD